MSIARWPISEGPSDADDAMELLEALPSRRSGESLESAQAMQSYGPGRTVRKYLGLFYDVE